METLLSVFVGIGLSAACGFRVFIPPLIISIAAKAGHLTLAPGFDWLGSTPALIAFAVATGLEIAAYYIPWLDNLLDTITTPTAVIAGTIVTASMVQTTSPFLQWTLAVIAGGGAAGVVQGMTVATRAASSTVTGGLGNPVVATGELFGSITTAILSLVVPVLAVTLLALGGYFIGRKLLKSRKPVPAPA